MCPNPDCEDGWCRKRQQQFAAGEINQFVLAVDNTKREAEEAAEVERQKTIAAMESEFGIELEDDDEDEVEASKEEAKPNKVQDSGVKFAYEAPQKVTSQASGDTVKVDKKQSLAELQAKLKKMQAK